MAETSKMMFILLLFVMSFIRSTYCGDEDEEVIVAVKKLREDILKDYDRHARPAIYNSNVTHVEIYWHLAYMFEIDEDKQTINIDSYLSLSWRDQHLTWDPRKYENIHTVGMKSDEIWKPYIYETQTGELMGDLQRSEINFFFLHYAGQVFWTLATVLPGRCTFDYSNYPSDTVICRIILDTWSVKGDTVDIEPVALNYKEEIVSLNRPNTQWKLETCTAKKRVWDTKCCGFYPSAEFTLTFTRNSPIFHQQLIYIASTIIVLLTLGMFWIPADVEQKITLGCIMMVILAAALLAVASSVKSTQVMIMIAGTVHTTMFVVTAAILFEILAINLQHIQECQPPEFLLNILSGTVGRVLCISSSQQEALSVDKMKLSEYEEGDVMLQQIISNGDWKTISQVLDRMLFIIYVIILSAIPKT